MIYLNFISFSFKSDISTHKGYFLKKKIDDLYLIWEDRIDILDLKR